MNLKRRYEDIVFNEYDFYNNTKSGDNIVKISTNFTKQLLLDFGKYLKGENYQIKDELKLFLKKYKYE